MKKVFILLFAFAILSVLSAFVIVKSTNESPKATTESCKLSAPSAQYVPDVTYSIDEDYDQFKRITIYNLMVKNNTDRDLYVKGTVHVYGTADYETSYYAGIVEAHSRRGLFTSVEDGFYVVKMEYFDAL